MAIRVNGELITPADSAAVRDLTAETFEVEGRVSAEIRLTELDQADPAGRFRFIVTGDQLLLQHSASSAWATATTLLVFDDTGIIFELEDDEILAFGTDSDVAMVLRSALLAADAALTNVIVGAGRDHQGVAANSLMVSNITASGDIGFYVNLGGNSLEAILVDTSASQVFIGWGGFDLIVPDGRGVVIGASAQIAVLAVTPEAQVLGTAGADGSVVVLRSSADASGPVIYLAKARDAIGTFTTAITTGDVLGGIEAIGADGVDLNANANAAAAIRFVSSGTIAADRIPGEIRFLTATDAAPSVLTESFRVANDQNIYVLDANGVVIGNTAQLTVSIGDGTTAVVPEFQELGTTAPDSTALIGRFSADALGGALSFLKSRAAIGAQAIVVSGDAIGTIRFLVDDGVDYRATAASIQGAVDGTPGVGDAPGRLVFSTTADGAEGPSESFRISNDQNIYVANNNGVVIGAAAQITVGSLVSEVQILGGGAVDGSLILGSFPGAVASEQPRFHFVKSRSATVGSFAIVADDDVLGAVTAFADDGVTYNTTVATIQFEVDDASPAVGDIGGAILVAVNGGGALGVREVARWNASGDYLIANTFGVVVGHTAQVTTAQVGEFQVLGTAAADSTAVLGQWSAAATGPGIDFVKSRNATIGSFTVVVSGDSLGAISAYGDDGADYASRAGYILFAVDGTPGANDMPGRIVFATTVDGAADATERLRINNAGVAILGVGEGGITAATGNTFRASDIVAGGAGNIAGADLTIAAGLGTGTGDAGVIIFSLPIEAAAGDNLQSRVTALTMDMVSSATAPSFFFAAGSILNFNAGDVTVTHSANLLTIAGGDLTVPNLTMTGTALSLGGIAYVVPPDDGDAGEQLQTNGTGTLTWEVAASYRAAKLLEGELAPADALDRILNTRVHTFRYNPEVRGVGGDYETLFAGVIADEAPWVMMHNGRVFSAINAFGHTVAAIQALDERIDVLEQASQVVEDHETRLSALEAENGQLRDRIAELEATCG